jgi:hypothetical protein
VLLLVLLLLVCRYSATLRLDPSLPPAAVAAKVERVLRALGLSHVAGSTVLSGTGVTGVSGGERRRVAIAMELVIDPQVRRGRHPLGGGEVDWHQRVLLWGCLSACDGRLMCVTCCFMRWCDVMAGSVAACSFYCLGCLSSLRCCCASLKCCGRLPGRLICTAAAAEHWCTLSVMSIALGSTCCVCLSCPDLTCAVLCCAVLT